MANVLFFIVKDQGL
jgi:hypothetical protein